MGTKQPQDDIPVEIRGYVTDPKLVGYQILTNYESLYWRCLVGRDAWSLYELLRTFCHDGKDTCNPSIHLLMATLGLTDRRQLIGRVTTTRGKERVLPGLIDLLQQHNLAIAEMQGDGPTLRYVFHVNLTPPPLTPAQVASLPPMLQRKHAQLMERVAASAEKLASVERKKPIRSGDPASQGDRNGFDRPKGGSGTVPPPPGTVPPPPGTVPPKQQQINNTHLTTTRARDEDSENNNSGGANDGEKGVVVDNLKNLGIGEKVAQRLADRYGPERLREKVDYLAFLQETEPKKITNPRGWLRRAIEEDYGPPDGYKPKAEREAEAAQKARRQQAIAEALAAQEETERPPSSWREWVPMHLELADTLRQLSDRLRDELKGQVTEATFHTWISQHVVTEVGEGKAQIAVPSRPAQEWLTHRLKGKFEESLSYLVGQPVQVEFFVLERPPLGGGG